jgi:competence protein ComEC
MSTHLRTFIFIVGIVLGIVIGYGSAFASEIALGTLTLAFTQALVFLVERRELRAESEKREAEGFALSFATTLLSFGIVVGIVRVQLVQEKNPYVCEGVCTFNAKVISSPESKDAYQTAVVHPLEIGEEMYDVQIRVPLYPTLRIGETVRLSGKAKVPDIIPPHNGVQSFDYAAYLATRNVGSEMLFPKVEVIDEEPHTTSEYLGRWKEDLVERMNEYVSSPASSLAGGMLFGNSSTSKDVVQTFRVAGLSHIIVLSGFNIAIVIASILFVFAFIPLVLRIGLASFFVIVFVLMVGAEASVLRATIMAFIGLLATLLGRAYVARQALLLSFLAIILYEPNALLHDVSLHLSFLATAGIVYLSDPMKKTVEKYVGASFVELLTTTLAAYIATLPYIMYTFGSVSVYALLANMLALPLVPLAMLFSFFVVTLSYVSHSAAMLFGYGDTMLIDIILFIARIVESLPFSYVTLTISFFSMCVAYAVMIAGVLFFSNKRIDETLPTIDGEYLTDIIKY